VKKPINNTLPDANGRERLSLIPLVALALIMGVASPLWMRQIDPAVRASISTAQKINAKSSDSGTTQSAELQKTKR
jgi:NADH-quinone oxidoreductase subunit M